MERNIQIENLVLIANSIINCEIGYGIFVNAIASPNLCTMQNVYLCMIVDASCILRAHVNR